MMKTFACIAVILCVALFVAKAQTDPSEIVSLTSERLQSPDTTSFELRRFLLAKVPPMPSPKTASEWTREATKLRKRILKDFVFRGWPSAWIDTPTKVEDLGAIPSGHGYRMRKLRYEVVPNFYATAILYEPEKLQGRIPAIINTNGHVGAEGKAIEYKQKRCINQALQGMIALNLEWPGFGELSQPGNAHFYYAHLDLVGSSGLGLFYLTIRRALDYLCAHPNVDPARIGMTGLSGGGFQTILLSSLDERVKVAVPVAGFASEISRIERIKDVGDIEHHVSDLLSVVDYPVLVALRAPRPTLLIYNAEDSCCYRAPLVKPYVYDQVRPFFNLYGRGEDFQWYQHTDLPIHNYQVDNRQQAYRFFTRHFDLPVAEKEIPVDSEIKSFDELAVGLPTNALTILGVARKLADTLERPTVPGSGPARVAWVSAERSELRKLVRYQPVDIQHAWPLGNTHSRGLETISYRYDFSNNLSAAGVWLKAVTTPNSAPGTVVLNDSGKKASNQIISQRVNRGEQVIAADLLFTGDMIPGEEKYQRPYTYAQLLTGLGDRALGLEVAQLISISRRLQTIAAGRQIGLEIQGIRGQVIALVASAIEPGLFSEVFIRDGMRTLRYLLDKPIGFPAAPDLFCFGLFKRFDIDRLKELSAPSKILQTTVNNPQNVPLE